jgi:hypothetical protein
MAKPELDISGVRNHHRETKNGDMNFSICTTSLSGIGEGRELVVLQEVNANTELNALSAFLALTEDQRQRKVQLEACDGMCVDKTNSSRAAREAVGELLEGVLDALLYVIAALFAAGNVLQCQ